MIMYNLLAVGMFIKIVYFFHIQLIRSRSFLSTKQWDSERILNILIMSNLEPENTTN